MATAATAQAITEKRSAAAAIATKDLAVYTRTVTFPISAAFDSGTANLTGLTIPANTLVLGGTISSSVSQGSGALKFSLTTDGDICGATVPGNAVPTALASPVQIVATADRVVTFTPSVALSVGTLTLTLILCAVGGVTGRSPSVGN